MAKKTFQELIREGYQIVLPLPPIPGIRPLAARSTPDATEKSGSQTTP